MSVLKQKISYTLHLTKCLLKSDHDYLAPVFRLLLPDDAVILDLGAHGGQFSKLFSRLFPQGQVFSFEPGGYARSILEKVVKLRGLKNVEIIPMALGEKPDNLTLNMPIKKSGSRGYGLSHLGQAEAGRNYTQEMIEQTTVDQFVKSRKLNRLSLIKADIEGWEGFMLRGGAQSIQKFKPVLYLELYEPHLKRTGEDLQEIWDMLMGWGYRAHVYDEAQDTLETVDKPDGDNNFFFIASQE
jgi:FkbM family methyltransferase